MSDDPLTAKQLEGGIANALAAHNMEAVVDMLRALVVVDARRAERVYSAIKLGMEPADEADA